MRYAVSRAARPLPTLAVLSLVALLTLGSASASAANSFGHGMFGIAAGGAIQGEDPATLGRDLDAIQASGAKWLRVDINWAVIQAAGPQSYDWSPTDRVVQGARARGLDVLGVIVYTPSWARPAGTDATYGPDPRQYAAFAAAAARHYSSLGVDSYEVWNEPNVKAFWDPSPNPADYTRMLKAAYPAIKGADPQSTVLTGGTAPAVSDGTNWAPVDWLKQIYANGGRDYFDAVAEHPYCFDDHTYPGDAKSWSAWYQMYGTSPSVRSVMVDNGDGAKKIWGTEFGAPTGGPGWTVSEDAQAQIVARAYQLWQGYDWAGPLFVYQGRDQGTDASNREDFFGLEHYDFSKKPAYTAYQNAVADLSGGDGTGGGGTGGGTGGGSAPTNTSPPTVSGIAQQGQTLSASNGSWSDSPTSYAYQWRRCDGSGTCVPIPGATSSSYQLTWADVGSTVRIAVTASNSSGSGPALSGPTAVVTAAPASVIKVTGKGKDPDHGQPKVRGAVSVRRPGSLRGSARIAGLVHVRLYRRCGGGWRPASVPRRARLQSDGRRGHGRFHKHLRALRGGRRVRPGTYRVRATYPGGRGVKPSTSLSRKFKVRR